MRYQGFDNFVKIVDELNSKEHYIILVSKE
jgi:hypothetical protein